MKHELHKGKVCCIESKTYNYLKVHNDENKKAKGIKKCVIKRKLKFEGYKSCLEVIQFENEITLPKKNKLANSLRKNHKNT